MLNRIVAFSLRFRGVVLGLACLLVGYGLYVTAHAKRDVFPDFLPPQVIIQTEAPGLSSEEVEQLVTRPVESSVNGAGDLDALRSQSIQGLSVVTAVFRDGTDIYRARQLVAERLAQIDGTLPSGVGVPRMNPLTSSMSMVLAFGLTSTSRTPMEVRTFADSVVVPRLLGVPGVAKVSVFGGDVRQLQIQVDPDTLRRFDLALDDIVAAARNATGKRGAGFVEDDNQRITLRTEGALLTADQLGEVVFAHHRGRSLRLRDVAIVTEGAKPPIGAASIMGTTGVVLVVSNQLGANTIEVTERVERALNELKAAVTAQQITLHEGLFRPANFIDTAIHNVRFALLLGGALVAIVLFLFLANVRMAAISFTAIPLSLLGAIIVLDKLGITLNTLTLGGLAIAIGEVVDDAIIDVENILRRLRENAVSTTPKPVFRIVLDASIEVRSAVVYATFVVALVFMPVLAMGGIHGKLFAPLGLAYILATLVSLAVALTVTPAMALALFHRRLPTRAEPAYIVTLKARYRTWLATIMGRPRALMAFVTMLCVLAVAALPFFGGAFLPELREGHFIVHMSAVPGTSLGESLRLGKAVTAELLKNPHIRAVAQRVGRAELADDTWGSHYSEFNVDLKPVSGEEGEFVQSEIREALVKFSGVYFAVKPFLTERIEETISGTMAEVVVKLYGDDLDQLDAAAQDVARIIGGIEGAVDVQVESPPGAPQQVVKLRPERLREYGIQPVAVLDAIETAYSGATVGQTYEGNRTFDVVVLLDAELRKRPENAGALLLRNPDGAFIPVSALADVYMDTGRYMITHEGARRRQGVTCNVRGRDIDSFVAEARGKVTAMLPNTIYVQFTGVAEAKAAAQRDILVYSLLAGASIVVLLTIALRNGRNLALVIANLPFALVGGVLAIVFTGGWLTVGSLVGLVTLFGISARNSIMLVSHFEHLVAEEGCAWNPETALRGATERFVPIMMTALVTALGLLPIAASYGRPGHEIESPMAIVILAGLISSTFLNLFVMPTLALRFGRFEAVDESLR